MTDPSMQTPPPSWPEAQTFITEAQAEALLSEVDTAARRLVERMQIPIDIRPLLRGLYLPMAAWLAEHRRRHGNTLVVGLTGGQGSGKSTISALLVTVLEQAFGQRAVALSIDDIYATHATRQQLGREVHPLLATRGPPGTHDTALGLATLAALRALAPGARTLIPAFDKAVDDRRPRDEWPEVEGPIDIVLFEGWCVNARAEPAAALAEPLNALEREEDPHGVWRRHVNDALSGDYAELFGQIDVQIALQISSMDRVFEWRELQEAKLREEVAARNAGSTPSRVMDAASVRRFVQHYERITRHLLRELPTRSDVVIDINDAHQPAEITVHKPL